MQLGRAEQNRSAQKKQRKTCFYSVPQDCHTWQMCITTMNTICSSGSFTPEHTNLAGVSTRAVSHNSCRLLLKTLLASAALSALSASAAATQALGTYLASASKLLMLVRRRFRDDAHNVCASLITCSNYSLAVRTKLASCPAPSGAQS
jgi:hypothetical protein